MIDQPALEVIVADPDDARRARTARALRAVGWSVRESRGAHEAIEACRGALPSVMVVDTDACNADDLQMIDAIKSDPELFPVGVVIRSRQLDVDEALDGLARGAHGVLVDPVADAELVASVRSAARTGTLQRELRSRAVALERLAFSDALTEVANRRFLDRQLDALVGAAARHGRPLSVAMIDLDHFKAVNDAHGHGVGDAVLAEVAHRLADRLRVEDHLGRFGGEEFLVLLPDTDADAAAGVAEALRAAVCAEPIAAHGVEISMTASVGWAVYEGESPHELVGHADAAMYRAKADGRNRVAGPQRARAA